MRLYVEARIRAGTGTVWDRSQSPELHQRWDLRFGEIELLPGEPGAPRRFRYATRVLPGLTVSGTGISAGEQNRPGGTRTSALRFASAHPLSFIEEGRGYWRYVPDGDALRFLTGYDYRPRWGRFGRVADRLVLRPLMGWATAWSFDRLRLWCEHGITPERSMRYALAEVSVRLAAVLGTTSLAFTGTLPGPAAAHAVPAVLAAVALASLLPPSRRTPAARRCLRRPPARSAGTADRASTAAPTALLTALEKP
ncbi:hypothetical protein ACFPA8_18525 [Streptomyces ovatisporus]|uniref:Membrane protein YndG n=1 Tax=Streptomyces ovatisporus TaxID=1128682 RepID=A0ABV9A8A5_9ACTN